MPSGSLANLNARTPHRAAALLASLPLLPCPMLLLPVQTFLRKSLPKLHGMLNGAPTASYAKASAMHSGLRRLKLIEHSQENYGRRLTDFWAVIAFHLLRPSALKSSSVSSTRGSPRSVPTHKGKRLPASPVSGKAFPWRLSSRSLRTTSSSRFNDCRTRALPPIHYRHGSLRRLLTSLLPTSRSSSTAHCRPDTTQLLSRWRSWRPLSRNRGSMLLTPVHTGRSRTCQSSRSCWNDSSSVNSSAILNYIVCCHNFSPGSDVTIQPRPQFLRYCRTFFQRSTVETLLPLLFWICRQRSTQLIMKSCWNVCGARTVSAAVRTTGSSRTYTTVLSRSVEELLAPPSPKSSAAFHRGRYLVQFCSSCTSLMSSPLSRNTVFSRISTPMTRRSTVGARHLTPSISSCDSRRVSTPFPAGCGRTGYSSTRARPSSSGVLLRGASTDCPHQQWCSGQMEFSRLVLFGIWASTSTPTSWCGPMSRERFQGASWFYVNYAASASLCRRQSSSHWWLRWCWTGSTSEMRF